MLPQTMPANSPTRPPRPPVVLPPLSGPYSPARPAAAAGSGAAPAYVAGSKPADAAHDVAAIQANADLCTSLRDQVGPAFGHVKMPW